MCYFRLIVYFPPPSPHPLKHTTAFPTFTALHRRLQFPSTASTPSFPPSTKPFYPSTADIIIAPHSIITHSSLHLSSEAPIFTCLLLHGTLVLHSYLPQRPPKTAFPSTAPSSFSLPFHSTLFFSLSLPQHRLHTPAFRRIKHVRPK